MRRSCCALVALAIGLICDFAPAQAPSADDATRDLNSANGLLQRGLYELAAADYRRFLDAQPRHAQAGEARYGLAVCLLRLGKPDDALPLLEGLSAQRDFAYAAEAAFLAAQCRLALERFEPAAAAFDDFCKRFADHALRNDAAALAVEAWFRGGKPDEALRRAADFVSAAPRHPSRARVEYFAALAQVGRGDWRSAAPHLRFVAESGAAGPLVSHARLLLAECARRAGDLGAAAAALRELSGAPDDPYAADALLALAGVLEQRGERDEAQRAVESYIQKFPKHVGGDAARLQLARLLLAGGAADRAEAVLKQLADDKPGAIEVEYLRAKCELRREQFAAAAQRLAQLRPRAAKERLLPEILYDEALAHFRADQPRPALAALREFAADFPEHALRPDALALQARIELTSGDQAAALKTCDAFLKQYSGHGAAADVQLLAAGVQARAGQPEAAEQSYRRFLAERPDDPAAGGVRLRLGLALRELKRPAEAEQALKDALTGKLTADEQRAAWRALAELAFDRSDWPAAVAAYERCLGVEPASAPPDALLKLGLAQARAGESEKAVTTFDRLLAAGPPAELAAQAQFEKGQALLALQREDEAERVFRTVADGGDARLRPFALQHLAALASKRGRSEEAARYLAQVADSGADAALSTAALRQSADALLAARDYDAAEKAYARFLAAALHDPQAGAARARRALALARLDRSDAALPLLESAASDESIAADAELVAVVRYEQAWCLRKLGRVAEAIAAYRALLALPSASALVRSARLELAELLMAQEKFADAAGVLEELQKPGAVDSADAPLALSAGYALALCRYRQEQWPAAVELFESFLKQAGTDERAPAAALYCAEALLKLNQPQKALPHLERAAQPAVNPAIRAPALLRLGECAAQLQRWDDSQRAYAQYIELEPDGPQVFQARFGVGWAHENRGRLDDAIAEYRAVIAGHQGPTAARAQFQIGECLFALKRYPEALRELLRVEILYSYPEWSAAALYEAGRCLELMDKPDDARKQFETVRSKYADTRWAALAAQALSKPAAPLPGQPRTARP